MTKQTWIIILLAAVALGGFLWYKNNQSKTDLSTAKPADGFDVDDTAMYNRLVEIFKAESSLPSNLDWINPLVTDRYKSRPTKIMGGSRASKAETFYSILGEINNSEKGIFTDKSGKKSLYPQAMYDNMWSAMSSFRTKYSGL